MAGKRVWRGGVGARGVGEGRGQSGEGGARGPGVARYSDEELKAGLRRYARRVGWRPFQVREFHAWEEKPFGVNTVIKRFGSWHAALKSIGIEGAKQRWISEEDLLCEYERLWRERGSKPGERTVKLYGAFTKNPYRLRWGSLERFGLLVDAMRRGEISREEVLRRRVSETARVTVRTDVRWAVLKRDRYRCSACGRSPATDAGVELQIDHIVPVSKGGGNEMGNLRSLCRECNVGRGAGE